MQSTPGLELDSRLVMIDAAVASDAGEADRNTLRD